MSRLVVGVKLNNLLKFTEEVHEKIKYNPETGAPYNKKIVVNNCQLGNVVFDCDDFDDFLRNWDEEEFGTFEEFFKNNKHDNPSVLMCEDDYYLAYEITDCLDDAYSMIEEVELETVSRFKKKLEKYFRMKFDLGVTAKIYLTSA